ncbi:MAG TPA: NAD(P)H-dependent oxidoreductase [Thermoleophilia bacterium]
MNISVILAHPIPGSFNHAIADTVVAEAGRNGHVVSLHDLYREGFNPLLPGAEIPADAALPPVVAAHCEEIEAAGGIVIVHPNWWGQPPAILTGWIDRVMRRCVAYNFVEGDCGEGVPVGLLKARRAVVFNTSDTPEDREHDVFGDPLELIWKNCVFGLCGVCDVHRKTFSVVVTSTQEERERWLTEAKDLVGRCFPRNGP